MNLSSCRSPASGRRRLTMWIPRRIRGVARLNRSCADLGKCDASSGMERLVAKPFRRENAKSDEQRQKYELCEEEWRLGLCRSQRVQGRNLLEGLHNPDEDI